MLFWLEGGIFNIFVRFVFVVGIIICNLFGLIIFRKVIFFIRNLGKKICLFKKINYFKVEYFIKIFFN